MRFVLQHGGLHGAWCWDKLIPELEQIGHEAVALDLPGHGNRISEKATLGSYRTALVDVIERGDVLVGHSMGGFVISMAADAVPDKINRLIYLAGSVPMEGKTIPEAMPFDSIGLEQVITMMDTPEQGPCFGMLDFDETAAFLFHDCSVDDQRWAFERMTPQPLEPCNEPIHVPRLWSSLIPRNFIVCTEDRTHPIAYDNQAMRLLGLKTSLAMRTSHSPYISEPRETARLLDLCAQGRFDS